MDTTLVTSLIRGVGRCECGISSNIAHGVEEGEEEGEEKKKKEKEEEEKSIVLPACSIDLALALQKKIYYTVYLCDDEKQPIDRVRFLFLFLGISCFSFNICTSQFILAARYTSCFNI